MRLASNFALSLLEKEGKIYVGTGKGLTIITPLVSDSSYKSKVKWHLKSYAKSQGFLRVDFNPPALLSRSGRTWCAATDVLTAMDEYIEKRNNTPPPVYISAIDIMEQRQHFISKNERRKMFISTDTLWTTEGDGFYLKNHLPVDSGYHVQNHIKWDSVEGPTALPVNLNLPYDQNHLTLHFTGAHLSNGDKTRYRYFLQGNDKNWSPVTENTYADYRNLRPGKYIFKVRSRDFDGQWSKETAFKFTVSPPWWQTWWAYTIYVLVFIVVIRAYITFRSQRLRRENKVLEETVSHRTEQLQKSLEDLKATQTQLIQSEKMASLGELTAGIAHEIQNPLNFVNNFSEVSIELVDELKNEAREGNKEEVMAIAEDIAGNLEKVVTHGKRADSIVKSMMEHSRTSKGELQPTDINALADEYLRLAYHGMRGKDKTFNATLETHLDNSIGNIKVVPQDIGRVLLNLYNNAFYAVSEKKKQSVDEYSPTVSVSTKRENDKVIITVRDNGNGIPEKVSDKIFQPFFTTKPTGQGTGLGLSLAYDIVKAHGGELKVKTKEGEGSEFIIQLPVV